MILSVDYTPVVRTSFAAPLTRHTLSPIEDIQPAECLCIHHAFKIHRVVRRLLRHSKTCETISKGIPLRLTDVSAYRRRSCYGFETEEING